LRDKNDDKTVSLLQVKSQVRPQLPEENIRPVTSEMRISETIAAYRNYLSASGLSEHTVYNYPNDIDKLGHHLKDIVLCDITVQDLRNFIAHLRKTGEKPKSVERRISAIKNYFKWLVADRVITANPGAELLYTRAIPPLPDILNKKERDQFLLTASKNPRDYVLALILFEAGPKRNELSLITVDDVSVENQYRPTVRLARGDRYRDRTMILPQEFVPAYREYIDRYGVRNRLFDYSESGIKKFLAILTTASGISKSVSCQVARDTFAASRLSDGVPMETVLKMLGLAPSSVRVETTDKLARLAALY
jgi:site-specific recombinase XerD